MIIFGRLLAIGLLTGAPVAWLFEPRGDNSEHLRLSALIGMLAGQLFMVPLALVAGGLWIRLSGRPKPGPPGLPLAGLLAALGMSVLAAAHGLLDWVPRVRRAARTRSGRTPGTA
ncbi:hypothetical protein [Streptomyces sp. SYSU K21746]